MLRRTMKAALFRSVSVLALALAMGCSDETDTTEGPKPLNIPDEPDCDPLVPQVCSMPFPSSKWLVPDASRATGFTLTFGKTTLPQNSQGVHVDGTAYQRLDGFGVGTPAVAFFPQLDGSNLPGETQIADSLKEDSPVAMFEVTGNKATRIPCFAELDLAAKLDEERSIIVRPAVLLREGTRYMVALRGLKHLDGNDVAPSDAFLALRDKRAAGTPVEDRAPHFEEVFSLLGDAGIERSSLTLAWDWVTASSEALHGPLLHMRDEAFAELGDKSPAFTVTSIENYTEQQNQYIAYEVLGTFDVPDYMVGAKLGIKDAFLLNWGPDGVPVKKGTYKAEFRARVPRSAASGDPHGIVIHGHGLNGTHGQIQSGYFDVLAVKEKVVIVGCNMIGMSSEDVSNIIEMLGDLSGFPHLADRLHQGVLNHAFLVRGMMRGFDKIPEVSTTGLVIDPTNVFYHGISQGGIFGATHVAMSLDITRGHLGVPGNNYSTLLQRSTDFAPFFLLLGGVYPDPRDQQVLLGLIQSLWDRTDPVSHYRHLKEDPFPGTPPHDVLLASATADWQVALLTNEIVTRSGIGVALMDNYGKEVPLVTPTPYPHKGSGLVNYSFGNPWPAPGNKPPFDQIGDPHGKPRDLDWHNDQLFHFYRTGEIKDVCGGDGCTPD